MSHFDYTCSRQILLGDPPFYALIMAAMRKADPRNQVLLYTAFPDQWHELEIRYNSPGGLLPGEVL